MIGEDTAMRDAVGTTADSDTGLEALILRRDATERRAVDTLVDMARAEAAEVHHRLEGTRETILRAGRLRK